MYRNDIKKTTWKTTNKINKCTITSSNDDNNTNRPIVVWKYCNFCNYKCTLTRNLYKHERIEHRLGYHHRIISKIYQKKEKKMNNTTTIPSPNSNSSSPTTIIKLKRPTKNIYEKAGFSKAPATATVKEDEGKEGKGEISDPLSSFATNLNSSIKDQLDIINKNDNLIIPTYIFNKRKGYNGKTYYKKKKVPFDVFTKLGFVNKGDFNKNAQQISKIWNGYEFRYRKTEEKEKEDTFIVCFCLHFPPEGIEMSYRSLYNLIQKQINYLTKTNKM